MSSDAEVLVVGAGPAGSTTAALLARAGHDVLILDKVAFPRFHVGESLLPVCLPVLDRLGATPEPEFYLYKRGAEFVDERTRRTRAFDFRDALEGCVPHAWHVSRASFDHQLLQRALAAGARFHPEAKVVRAELGDDRVVVHTREHALTARYLVDASGQNRLLARQLGSAEPIECFGHTAAFMHFRGASEAAFEEIGEGHDIRILITDLGWGWIIPLPGRNLSVGLVCREGEPAARQVSRYIESSALIGRWTRGCTRTEVRTDRNFSFLNHQPHGARFVCVGDSACFLDPVFSSGISLAMVGAQDIAERLGPALAEGREADPELMEPHWAFMEPAYGTFWGMIDRFYNTRFVEHFIFGPQGDAKVHAEIVTVLAGDVWRDDNDFQRLLLRSRRRQAS